MQNKSVLSSPPLWLLFLLVGFPQFSETVYSPALPNIAQSFHVGSHLVQWTLSIYFIGFALGVFVWGRISDHWGRRSTMLVGISIYIVGSILCLMANNIVWLLLARLVQGFGASSGSVLTQAIARESLHDQKRHHFFSAAGFAIAFSIALGPFIGGYLAQWFDWRANFGLLCILGISVVALAALALPETHCQDTTKKEKISKVFLMLIKDKKVLGSVWLVAAVNGILFSYYAEGPFIFIKIIHLTASQYGWLGSLIALAALLGSLASKRLIKHFSVNQLIAVGSSIMLISSIVLVLVVLMWPINANHKLLSVVFIMLPMMGIILGSFGFIIPMTLSTALQKYKSVLGTAGALFGLSYYVIIALLTWVMGLLHSNDIYAMPLYFLTLSVISFVVYCGFINSRQ